MNEIELKSVKGLKGMKFFVPEYQRGYRWEKQQVEDLLDDIKDFSNRQEKKEGEFYCLQPLVVREMEEDEKEKNNLEKSETWYEVIDGQQRLTTIYLILLYLKDCGTLNALGLPEDIYELKYQREANNDQDYLSLIADSFKSGNIDNSSIDCFNMNNAYSVIKEFLSKEEAIKGEFSYTLLKYKLVENDGHKSDSANNVRFIWYETEEKDPINVFTRLNIGKISLTNAELIKALFLNNSNFKVKTNPSKEKDVQTEEISIRLRQQEIAGEWDNIEYTLQDDEFWLFIHDIGYGKPTRIDFIFDLVCQLNLQENSNKDELNEYIADKDEYKTFRYFYKQFQFESNKEQWVKDEWMKIKNIFQIFSEWYDDLELYHYVGYLINQKKEIKDLISEWQIAKNKASFLSFLKDSIKSIIDKCSSLEFQYKTDCDDKRKCKPILLFHNIQTVINQNISQKINEKYKAGVFYKFPFHLYKIEEWDVEHINSNMENPEEDDDARKEWLVNVYLGVNKDIQDKISEYFDPNNSDNEERKDEIFKEIKEIVPEQDEWSSEDKNRIWNYALLDSSTNRAYGNSIFSGKRRVIIDKDKGESTNIPELNNDKKLVFKKQPVPSSFVPPCTKQVFLKYYSPAIGDNNYWQITDAQCYLDDIQNCINKLTEKN